MASLDISNRHTIALHQGKAGMQLIQMVHRPSTCGKLQTVQEEETLPPFQNQASLSVQMQQAHSGQMLLGCPPGEYQALVGTVQRQIACGAGARDTGTPAALFEA